MSSTFPERRHRSAADVRSIVAVHGLGSDVNWAWTWKDPADPENPALHVKWLQDPNMLPAVVPHSRILLYNYNSKWHKDAPKTRLSLCGEELAHSVRDFREGATASRPIVFVGHSLGGNVIQHALLYANSDDAFRHIATSTAGVVFLGSPLRGSKFQSLAKIMAWFSGFAGSHDGIVRDLAYDDENLMDTLHHFCRMRNTLSLATSCFFELHETDFAKKMLGVGWPGRERMVDEASACIPGLERRSLEANHSEMNKYSGPDDRSFRTVSTELLRLCSDAPAVVRRRTQPNRVITDRDYLLAERREAKKCLPYLFLTDPCEDMKKMKQKKGPRAKGTCDWILGTDELTAWLGDAPESTSPPTDVFWLHGNPGTGKSTMSMFLAGALSGAFSKTPNKTLAYYFCDSGYDTRKTATAVVRGLLLQLVQQHPQLIKYILPKYEERKAQAFASFDTLWTMFIKACADKATGRKYCVVDALDECGQDDQRKLLEQIGETFGRDRSAGGLNVSLLVTSRPYSEITKHLRAFPNRDLASFEESRQDVGKFIDEKVAELGKMQDYTKNIAAAVTRVLRDKAGGIFLWVGLACRELKDVDSRYVVKRLETMPVGLRSLYKQLLDTALLNEDPDMVKKLLSFIMVARRPLSTRELASACELYQDEDEEERIQFMKETIAACRLMIVVQDEKVLLLHQSVNEFLVREIGNTTQFIRELKAHSWLASRCVDSVIANLSPHKHDSLSTDDFVSYSTQFWPEHAHMAKEEFQIKDNQADFLAIDSRTRNSWWRSFRGHRSWEPSFVSIFYVAARWGIPLLVDHALLSEHRFAGASFHAAPRLRYVDSLHRDSEQRTPLEICAGSGHIPVLKIMLEYADPTSHVEEAVIRAVVRNEKCGVGLMEVLFELRGQVMITEDIVKAAAGNSGCGSKMMKLLLDRKGDDITITRDIVKAAAENGASGAEVMEILLARRADEVTITKGVIGTAMENWNSGAEVMGLLERAEDLDTITEDLFKAAARNHWNAAEVMEVLLKQKGRYITITPDIVRAAAENWQSGAEAMKVLLKQKGDQVTITPDIVKAAAGNWQSGAEVMRVLLFSRKGDPVTITKDIVMAAAGNKRNGAEIIRLLLDRDGDQAIISSDIVKSVAENAEAAAEVIEVLLDRKRHKVTITNDLIKGAARNCWNGVEVMKLLLGHKEDQIMITEDIVMAVVGNKRYPAEIMKLLLDRNGDQFTITKDSIAIVARKFPVEVTKVLLSHKGDEFTITEDIVEAAAGNWEGGAEVMKLILDRKGDEVTITEGILKAAAGNSGSGAEVMKLLLDRKRDKVKITEDIVKAAEGNRYPRQMMILLFDRDGDQFMITKNAIVIITSKFTADVMEVLLDRKGGHVKITEDIVNAAARNSGSGAEMMKLLLDRKGDYFTITKEIVKAAVENGGSGAEVMEILLRWRGDEVTITEDIVEAAAGNSGSGAEVMKLLLDRRGDNVKITEGIIKTVAGNSGSGAEMMKSLLNWRGDEVTVTVTEDIVTAAAGNSISGAQVMKLLLDRNGDQVAITTGSIVAVAGKFTAEMMELLLDRDGDQVKITEDIVKAAAGNWVGGAEMMKVLLDRRGNKVKITDDIVKASAGNRRSGTEVMKVLFSRKGDHVVITEDIVEAAAGNWYPGHVMKLLLDRDGDQFTITKEGIAAVAEKFLAEIMELFLDRKGDQVKITEDIVTAAARNSGSGAEMMKLLLDRKGDDFTITKEIVKAAVENGGSGAEVMEILLASRADEVTITEDIVKVAAGNWRGGAKAMQLLLNRKGDQFRK